MRPELKSIFFEYLNGAINIQVLENWIYSTNELQIDLSEETFIELIEFNFKDEYADGRLLELISSKILRESEFLEWKIKRLLTEFIETPSKTKDLLDEFYQLCTNEYNSQGKLISGFHFLKNLGLNYLYWMDSGYLKTHYGEKWQVEYKKCKDEIPFYHEQLLPIAEKILLALEKKLVVITGQGSYTIANDLKKELESEIIFKLKHKAGVAM